MTEHDHDFWRPDRTNWRKQSSFETLSTARKLCLALLIGFCLVWAFYCGVALAGSNPPEFTGEFVDQDSLYQSALVGDDGMLVVLAVGCDKRADWSDDGRTDTILAAFIDIENSRVNVVSIPRDTYITIPSSGEKTKINHAYFYGGIPLTKSTIEETFGIAIDNYAEINFQGFEKAINAIGGVPITVEEDMINEWEGINIKAGEQVLDGKNALGYVRYRDKIMADIGRIGRQQKFLGALTDTALSPANIWKMPGAVSAIWEYIRTDITLNEALSLINFMKILPHDNISFKMLPGKPQYINGVSYWVQDEQAVAAMLEEILNPPAPAPEQLPTEEENQ